MAKSNKSAAETTAPAAATSAASDDGPMFAMELDAAQRKEALAQLKARPERCPVERTDPNAKKDAAGNPIGKRERRLREPRLWIQVSDYNEARPASIVGWFSWMSRRVATDRNDRLAQAAASSRWREVFLEAEPEEEPEQ